jgi:hypothetical protein
LKHLGGSEMGRFFHEHKCEHKTERKGWLQDTFRGLSGPRTRVTPGDICRFLPPAAPVY